MKIADLKPFDYAQQIEIWFLWPWFDLRYSTALALDFTRWLMPKGPELVAVDEAASDGSSPYRDAELKPSFHENTEQYDARMDLEKIFDFAATYAHGGVPTAPPTAYVEYDDPLTRLYWWIPDLAKHARVCAGRAARLNKNVWQPQPLETALTQTLGIVRKFAVKSQAAGAPDGAGNANLINIVNLLSEYEVAQVEDRVIHWRFVDGLRGRPFDPELRPAFEAAWIAEQYEFAYSLLEDPLAPTEEDDASATP